ncbi:hypothetical protein [Ramlibacter algicola]|uniref:Uncharacterized protein n=1 Tax=Ramlibacter algicola TaxID=2795217 RepID=A0A934Q0A9_9BURK|nr:hypothetical protein [Ramlibacter algicola]MBK0391949.1 hypothetical protein [Ramlibacter algicola]
MQRPLPSPPATSPRTGRALERASLVAAVALALATVVLVLDRLRYGVDFTDEAFYTALPFRLAMGAVPFRDENSLGLLAGFFGLPVVQASLWWHGSTEGLMLVMRHSHLAFTAAVGGVVWFAARHWVGPASALAVAAVALTFSPFTIHGLSYNTLACGFLTMALFLAARARQAPATGRWFTIGVLLALASAVYPTLAVGAVAFVAISFVPRPPWTLRRPLLRLLAGGLAVIAAVSLLVVAVGMESVREVAAYMSAFQAQGGGAGKLVRVAADFVRLTPQLGALVASAFIAACFARLDARLLGAALVLVCAVLWQMIEGANGTSTLYIVTAVAVIAPLLAPAAGDRETVRALMRGIWWPSITCALITGWSSSNGATNASIGAFPAALCTLLFLQMAWRRSAAHGVAFDVVSRVGALAAPALLGAVLLTGDAKDYYGDPAQRQALTQRVTWGPYKGLFTTPERARALEEFRVKVLPQVRSDDRPVVFDALPGGYLLFGLPAATNSVWLPPAGPGVDRSLTVGYWDRRMAPTIAFITPKTARSGDPLLEILARRGFEPTAKVELGTLLRRKD